MYINSDLTAEPLNQNLSPEYRDPSPEVLKSAQANDKKAAVYLSFRQVAQTLSLYLGSRVLSLESVNSDLSLRDKSEFAFFINI